MSAGSEQTEPATPVPSTPPSEPAATPAMPSMAAFGSNESCPNCNARMAADQRYCLNCGHRRGDPRLPFMDAVVFMESMNSAPGGAGGAGGATPPPPPAQSGGSNNRWNANAALIAGVATLVLAIGVGFLIGRTGHNDNSSAAAGPVRIVQVGGSSAVPGEEAGPTPEAAGPEETGGKAKSGGTGSKSSGKAPAKKKTSEVKEGSTAEKELAKEKTKEVLHTAGNVELAEPEQKIGGACQEGQAGCEGGKFKGNFFE